MSALRPFMTGIADALREKKKTIEPIPAVNFAKEIEGLNTVEIEDGSLGSVYLESDGQILHSISKTYNAKGPVLECFLDEEWRYVTIDQYGYTYNVIDNYNNSSKNIIIRKYTPALKLMWERKDSVFVSSMSTDGGVEIDNYGGIYVFCNSGTNKYDQDGNLCWRMPNANCGRVVLGSNDEMYTYKYQSITKATINGDIIWKYITSLSSSFEHFCVSNDGYVHHTGNFSSGYYVEKINVSGENVIRKQLPNYPVFAHIDKSGALCLQIYLNGSSYNYTRYDENLNGTTISNAVYVMLMVDTIGNFFINDTRDAITKIDGKGNLIYRIPITGPSAISSGIKITTAKNDQLCARIDSSRLIKLRDISGNNAKIVYFD